MTQVGSNSLATRSTLDVGGKSYAYYSLAKAAETIGDVSRLPFSMKVLLENMLRFEDEGFTVGKEHIQAIADWQNNPTTGDEIQYRPARVLLQDFTGVPCVVDLAAMRDAIAKLGGDTAKINPQVPVNLVIDHSVMVDEFGHPKAFENNMALEYARNAEHVAKSIVSELCANADSYREPRAFVPGDGFTEFDEAAATSAHDPLTTLMRQRNMQVEIACGIEASLPVSGNGRDDFESRHGTFARAVAESRLAPRAAPAISLSLSHEKYDPPCFDCARAPCHRHHALGSASNAVDGDARTVGDEVQDDGSRQSRRRGCAPGVCRCKRLYLPDLHGGRPFGGGLFRGATGLLSRRRVTMSLSCKTSLYRRVFLPHNAAKPSRRSGTPFEASAARVWGLRRQR